MVPGERHRLPDDPSHARRVHLIEGRHSRTGGGVCQTEDLIAAETTMTPDLRQLRNKAHTLLTSSLLEVLVS